jgi:hypothetical protein
MRTRNLMNYLFVDLWSFYSEHKSLNTFFTFISMSAVTEKCPAYSAFFGAMGATSAVVFSGMSSIELYLFSINSLLFSCL